MTYLTRLFRRMRAFLRGDPENRDMETEMRFHVEMEAAELERAGWEQHAAHREAMVRFGGIDRYRELGRAARGWNNLDSTLRDARHGARALLRSPSFSIVAVLTLALGIAANTAMFSVVNGVLLRPLPFANAERTALVWGRNPIRGIQEQGIGFPVFEGLRAQSRTAQDLAIWRLNGVMLEGGEAERIVTAFASANLFPLLGVEPAVGRFFTEKDEREVASVVVISYDLWQRRFGGSRDVLNQSVVLDGDLQSGKQGPRTRRIVGVLPRGFYFPNKDVAVYEPARTYWRFQREQADGTIRTWNLVALLRQNVTAQAAEAELSSILSRLMREFVATDTDAAEEQVAVVPALEYVTGRRLQLALWVLLGAVGFVLLIACANVANLTLARGAARERELATRSALGASRGQLLRQLLIENAILVALAGFAGVLLAFACVRLLTIYGAGEIPRLEEVRIDRVVLGFTALICIFTAVAFGLLPAWRLSRYAPHSALKEGGRGAAGSRAVGRLRAGLVIAQCALAIVLLTGAGLLLRSFQHLHAVRPGFQLENRLLMEFTLPSASKARQAGLQQAPSGAPPFIYNNERIAREIIARVQAIPGVLHAATSTRLIDRTDPDLTITIPGRRPGGAAEPGVVGAWSGSPELLEAIGVPLVRGRRLTDADFFSLNQHLEKALINESFARIYFPNDNPVGKRIRIGDAGPKEWWIEVVGVTGDLHRRGLEHATLPEFFSPVIGSNTDELIVHTAGDPRAIDRRVRAVLRSVNAGIAVLEVRTLQDHVDELSAERRFQTMLLVLFAGAALVLASIGIYGIVHYAVAQRTQEIGIRMALGARTFDVIQLVLDQGVKLTLVGVAFGLAGAFWLTRVLGHLLFEVSVTDPVTFGGVALLLIGVALVASYVPAFRASRVDPLSALRL